MSAEQEPQREPGHAEQPLRGALATARRPILIISVVLFALLMAGIVSLSDDGSAAHAEQAKDPEEQPLLVPARDKAAKYDEPADPSNGAEQGQPPSPGDRLPVSARGAGQGRAPSSRASRGTPSTFLKKQQEQLEEHALNIQKNELALREQAYAATTDFKSFEEAERQDARDLQNILASADGDSSEFGGDPGSILAAAGPALAALAQGAGGVRPGVGRGGMMAPGESSLSESNAAMRSAQAERLDFFQHGGDQLKPGRLQAQVRTPRSPYELQMGAVISGMLITEINSDIPGQIKGIVTKDVYDSIRHEYVLIPHGTQIEGTYSGTISTGQERVQGAVVRLNFENGNTLDLGGMVMAESNGAAGLHDRVNRHLLRRLGSALMTASATVGYAVTAPRNAFGTEAAIHRGLGEAILKMANDLEREHSQIPPTIEIRSGKRFIIQVGLDIEFPGPYEPSDEARSMR